MRRWQRVLVCLLLVCCILVNLSPLRANATGAAVAGTIAAASTVTVSAPMVVGASLIALGIYAGAESGVFETVVDTAVSTMSTVTDYIKDGTVELLRTVDALGNQAFYIAGEFFETLRQGLFDSDVLENSELFDSQFFSQLQSAVDTYSSHFSPCYIHILSNSSGPQKVLMGTSDIYIDGSRWVFVDGSSGYLFSFTSSGSLVKETGGWTGMNNWSYTKTSFVSSNLYNPVLVTTPYDLSLGQISTVPIDGTSARSWAGDDVADRNGLYVKYNNDPEPPDDNNGKWFWRLALPLTIAELIAMTQADEWSGETPEEFPAGDTVTEFEILDRPEIDGYQGIEISPVTDPNPDTGGDSGEDPDTGGDTDPTAPGEPSPDPEPDPDPEGGLDPDPDPGTDPDAGGDTGSDTGGDLVDVKPVNFFLDLRNYFPFCIPFDIAAFIGALVAPAEAPVFHWELQDLSGNVYPIDVDLSPWDAHAQLFRDVQLVLFIIGLALITRNMIKW